MQEIPISDLKQIKVVSADFLHLSGGLVARTHKDGGLLIGPLETHEAARLSIADTREYASFFEYLGLTFLGVETLLDDGIESSTWTLRGEKNAPPPTVIDDWGGISYALAQSGKDDLAQQAKRVRFALQASSLRLRDVSQQYQRQNRHAWTQKTGENKSFSNTGVYDLFLALHSVMTEMCTARDFLAPFMTMAGLTTASGDAMPRLAQSMKKLTNVSPLEESIVKAFDTTGSDPWLARLGRYRNVIIHEAPITELAQKSLLNVKFRKWNHLTFRMIKFELPDDPFTMSGNPIDALELANSMLHRVLDLANQIAKASGIKPSYPSLVHLPK